MTREEIEEFVEGIESGLLKGVEILPPGIDNAFIGWDLFGDSPIYDWELSMISLMKGRNREAAADHLNEIKQQYTDIATEGGYNPPIFIIAP